MSLPRIPFRLAQATKRKGFRCLSSGRRNDNEILDFVPGRSTATQSHPSTPSATSSSLPPLSATGFAQRNVQERTKTAEQVEALERQTNYTGQIWRRWNAGDVYAPSDLSGSEQKKWKMSRQKAQGDAIDTLGINPINEYKNFTIMSEFMTEMGRIKHSSETGLRPVNQRKMAKAIRRAIGLGLMPSVHRHPIVLKRTPASRWF
ncbi:ribosomal protein S18 [Dendryphion nanum]|uniref:Small ribosomal subunit protein bS18m n=1 Tax=Dendryphion nanum TaxID=256645 RepID=A0A9P9D9T7_9PLEO|nr:ribosomal protein S18 [Dendryphion nanum]